MHYVIAVFYSDAADHEPDAVHHTTVDPSVAEFGRLRRKKSVEENLPKRSVIGPNMETNVAEGSTRLIHTAGTCNDKTGLCSVFSVTDPQDEHVTTTIHEHNER